MDAAKPIIIKRVRKGGGHGHHGGAWKVAFADFVTAMMAFFLLMWLMGSTTPLERAAIADYFENPSGIDGPGGASTSMIKHGAVDAEMATHKPSENQEQLPVKTMDRDAVKEKQRLDSLKAELEQAILESDKLKDFKDQLLLDITPEGLRIQIIDKENRAMFDSGSSHLKDYTSHILYEIAKIINKVPNKISLTGHTDATPYSSIRGYTNWELSTDRANASRRALVQGGLGEEKIAKVVGLSSTVLFDQENPNSPVNRRISMIVMNKEAEESLLESSKQIQSSEEAAQLFTPKAAPSGPTLLPLGGAAPHPPQPAAATPKPLPLTGNGGTAPKPAPIQLPLKKAL